MDYPLNCTELTLLAWERPGQAVNSHLVFDFAQPLDIQRVKHAVSVIFAEIPLLKTRIIEVGRGASRQMVNEASESTRFTYLESRDESVETHFLHRPFDLKHESPFRIFYRTHGTDHRLILTLHHTAGDGMAQAFLAHEFFRAYAGLALTPWTKTLLPFRYREFLRKKIGWIKSALSLVLYLKDLCTGRKIQAASLIDRPSTPSREVAVLTLDLNECQLHSIKGKAKSFGLSQTGLILYAVSKVLHQLCEERGDRSRPIVLMIPFNFRFAFRIDRYLQNASGMNKIVVPRSLLSVSENQDKFKKLLEDKNTYLRALRVVFMAAVLNKFLGLKKLRDLIYKNDINPNSNLATILVSASRLPSYIHIPPELELIRMSGRGALFRSPGLGLILTGQKRKQTLTLEYLKQAYDETTVDAVLNKLQMELGI